MKKVELLAPAGSYEAFLGAVHAGADAVYLGGKKFGARAYADNFTTDEICRAVRYAHVYGRKVYLTLNTLVKTREFGEIYGYLLPLYRAGLDGVIIQDLGVLQAVGEWFPDLERHISTQMGITGVYGMRYVKELGASRVVPARELSLTEVMEMKKPADIEHMHQIEEKEQMEYMGRTKHMEQTNPMEIEVFVHGAICYCYSGQCLFSSLIGGRSGNRGRCAQPCRLPYHINGEKQESYPLSLKDMCTIGILPELIKAGIDSFKIEGRMKSPEYAAGVTAVYRKYIDRYYENPEKTYQVEKEDMEKLRALYIRSEISEGYYHRHNGREMVTLDSPAYAGRDEELARQIREEYLEGDFRLSVTARVVLKTGSPSILTLCITTEGGFTGEVSVEGEMVQKAQKQPLSKEAVRKQLEKTGNTPFRVEKTEIEMEADVFLPVKALNDLRRIACEKLEECIIDGNGFGMQSRHIEGVSTAQTENHENAPGKWKTEAGTEAELFAGGRHRKPYGQHVPQGRKKSSVHVSALTKEQCMAAVKQKAGRLYVSSGLWGEDAWLGELKEQCGEDTELYLALPYIIRQKDEGFLKAMEQLLGGRIFDGVLARNPEEVYWLRETFGKEWDKRVVSDAGLYLWNPKAVEVLGEYAQEHYLPYELNLHEIRELIESTSGREWAVTVYGRIPMMVTANCIVRTGGGCIPYRAKAQERQQDKPKETGKKRPAFVYLTDRFRKDFPVYTDCRHCYNVIYNSLPLSLHQNMEKLKQMEIHNFRLDFTTETGNDVDKMIAYFRNLTDERKAKSEKSSGNDKIAKKERKSANERELKKAGEPFPPLKEYTKGHMNRGVE